MDLPENRHSVRAAAKKTEYHMNEYLLMCCKLSLNNSARRQSHSRVTAVIRKAVESVTSQQN